MVSGSFSSSVSDFFAVDGDAGLGGDAVGDAAGELDAVDGEGVAGGNGGCVGFGKQDGAGAAHLLLEQPGRGVFGLGLEGVGADEFGEVGGLVGLGGAVRAHLVEVDFAAERCGLERGFRAGQTAADDLDFLHGSSIWDSRVAGIEGGICNLHKLFQQHRLVSQVIMRGRHWPW